GVEASGDLPLLVEDVAALLDPAGKDHVTVDAEEVLAVEARLLALRQRADWLCFPGNGHAGSNCSRSLSLKVWARPPTGFGKSGARPSATGSSSALPAGTPSAISRSSSRSCPPRARPAAARCGRAAPSAARGSRPPSQSSARRVAAPCARPRRSAGRFESRAA